MTDSLADLLNLGPSVAPAAKPTLAFPAAVTAAPSGGDALAAALGLAPAPSATPAFVPPVAASVAEPPTVTAGKIFASGRSLPADASPEVRAAYVSIVASANPTPPDAPKPVLSVAPPPAAVTPAPAAPTEKKARKPRATTISGALASETEGDAFSLLEDALVAAASERKFVLCGAIATLLNFNQQGN